MTDNIGLDRVISPEDMTPAAAWKINNSKDIKDKEALVSLEKIHLECDSFQQIAKSCGYDDHKIKAKILDIVGKRGKLHNPFSKTGGTLMGTISQIGKDFDPNLDVKIGDKIYCLASICNVPVYIEAIKEIDYDYGQITCTGYAVMFQSFPMLKRNAYNDDNYYLAAIDEGGSILGAYNAAKEYCSKIVAIIGRDIHTTIIYAAAIRSSIGDDGKVVAIMDNGVNHRLSLEEISETMKPLVDEIFFVDISRPLETYRFLGDEIRSNLDVRWEDDSFVGIFDQVVVAEDMLGAETLAIALARLKGVVYFSSMKNNYGIGSVVAESFGKDVIILGFEQSSKGHPDFTMEIIDNIKDRLEKLNDIYKEKRHPRVLKRGAGDHINVVDTGKVDDFVFQSIVTKNMVDEAINVARYDCNVIIQGETGVGKEHVLSLIHKNSERKDQPCIRINCATIQESLAESEFFGYEGGAFTGAKDSGRKGYFEMANKGILFLDEIGLLPLNMQSKLLRVLQENQFYKVGGTQPVNIDVRVIVANNISLKSLVDEGKFREDLYYRLNICTIDVPPLRDRREDILCLSESFVGNWRKKYGVAKELSPEALDVLYNYRWPGNVRELENIIHRLVINSHEIVIREEDVLDVINENTYGNMVLNIKKNMSPDNADFHNLMEQQEKLIIEFALKKCGTTRKAAEYLSLPQTTFARKKLKHGL